ncbi:hypothetical protein PPERSA_12524 [Pseudocohnilembus persalinus]|uniref:Uncharacterized protein n=1 Tax=Pseudocohnilembus persalinus TaxID=266149 RepID=A0A0V0QAZ5_PSEPJ|nr:hypothetical protein PPERSA_12524 [Pseudocohnilembus persalinus]|eukprot:KRW99420.1 hypothetical protein PPERSA_12524 [Pseudocohnilembus persalinus]
MGILYLVNCLKFLEFGQLNEISNNINNKNTKTGQNGSIENNNQNKQGNQEEEQEDEEEGEINPEEVITIIGQQWQKELERFLRTIIFKIKFKKFNFNTFYSIFQQKCKL